MRLLLPATTVVELKLRSGVEEERLPATIELFSVIEPEPVTRAMPPPVPAELPLIVQFSMDMDPEKLRRLTAPPDAPNAVLPDNVQWENTRALAAVALKK